MRFDERSQRSVLYLNDLSLRWKTLQNCNRSNSAYRHIEVHKYFEALACFHPFLFSEVRQRYNSLAAFPLFINSLRSQTLPRSLWTLSCHIVKILYIHNMVVLQFL